MAVINNSICEYCHTSCKTCSSLNNSVCTSCYNLTYLHVSSCLSDCLAGTFADSTSNKCLPCQDPCQNCLNATNCLSCRLGSNPFFENGACVGCISSCDTCNGTKSNCTSCSVTKGFPYLLNNTCLLNCPSKYYNDPLGICSACISPCESCTSSLTTTCLTCIPNRFFFPINGV